MTTVVPGLIKIGKTGTSNFEARMYQLERHGYNNVVGLKRHFAIEVESYNEKELLLQEIFSKSRLKDSELFALDVKMVKSLLSSFEGEQIYPEVAPQPKVDEETPASKYKVPDGIYYLGRKSKRWGRNVEGTMRVENGRYILQKGSICCPIPGDRQEHNIKVIQALRKKANIVDDVLQEDMELRTPSSASSFLMFSASNGWIDWKTADGKPISIFRDL